MSMTVVVREALFVYMNGSSVLKDHSLFSIM